MAAVHNRLILIIGGAGSGKSEFAEKCACEIFAEKHACDIFAEKQVKPVSLWYLATMSATDSESVRKIQKHVERRKNSCFKTAELPYNIGRLSAQPGDVVLLECMSNLLANEMYMLKATSFPDDYSRPVCAHESESDINADRCVDRILHDIRQLHDRCDLVIVSNEVTADGCDYDESTLEYIRNLALINRRIADMADEVVEVVVGIPIHVKNNGR